MASIKSRIADLERSRNMALRREMTDVQLALRVMHILNHPESFPSHAPLTEILKRTLVAVQQRRN